MQAKRWQIVCLSVDQRFEQLNTLSNFFGRPTDFMVHISFPPNKKIDNLDYLFNINLHMLYA